MTAIAGNTRKPQPHSRRMGRGLALFPIAFVLLACVGVGFVVYLLWPRWPGVAVGPDAPALPVTIAGVAFNVPPAAIRVPIQRRPGAHERIDLAFEWPSLEPSDPNAKPAALAPDPATAPPTIERLFVTLQGAGETLAPDERVRTIYPRYTAAEALSGPAGLLTLPFRDGTPYQGEDLIYQPPANNGFFVRCTRNAAGPTRGVCLYERRIDKADIVVRFPRDWLNDWRQVASKIDRLIAGLRPAADVRRCD